MKHKGTIFCSVLLIVSLGNVLAIPQGEDDNSENTQPRPPPAGSKPPSFIAGLSADDEDATQPDKGGDGDEVSGTLAPISENTPLTGDSATEAPVVAPNVDVPNTPDKGTEKVPDDNDDDCGPACMLVNQTPIILLICILVVVLLLLVILFGCYFMKKLHGKAIFTSVQRHEDILRREKNAEALKRSSNSPKKAVEGKHDTTTSSTLNADQLNNSPVKEIEDRV